MKRMHFELAGMTCDSCVRSLTEKLDMLRGITESDVRLNEMDLVFDESLCSVVEIVSAVRGAGLFEVKEYSPIANA